MQTTFALVWWSWGLIGLVIYILLLVFLGIRCLRQGHVVWFILGIFVPLCWLIGALLPARR